MRMRRINDVLMKRWQFHSECRPLFRRAGDGDPAFVFLDDLFHPVIETSKRFGVGAPDVGAGMTRSFRGERVPILMYSDGSPVVGHPLHGVGRGVRPR